MYSLPKNIIHAIKMLNASGYEAHLVGGCVRDMLMDLSPADYDIATSALPHEIMNVFSSYKMALSGIKHGTITPIIDGVPIEITTYRIDGEYKDNRHPESVKYTKVLEDDLSRRDFTVNAMAMDLNFNLTDPFFGVNDIKNSIIRCVGVPEKRFNEDALRIMRALRFSSTLAFKISSDTAMEINKMYKNLSKISAERILSELKKLIVGKNAREAIMAYEEVFLFLMPSLTKIKNFHENVNLLGTDDLTLNLAILMKGLSSLDIKETLSSLKCEKSLISDVISLNMLFLKDIESIKDLKYLLFHHSSILIKKLIEYKVLTSSASEADLYDMLEKAENSPTKIKDLSINGDDLLKMGYEGRKIGEILDLLLKAVIEGECDNEKDSLCLYLTNL